MQVNPVLDFLKYARAAPVRAHTRAGASGQTVQVEQYVRKEDDAESQQQELTAKKEREIALWQAWKSSGESPHALKPLLRSFRPMIQSKVNVYKGKLRMIPDSTIEAEFNIQFVGALKSYDPSKGSLGTYVYRYLDKAKRFIVENQNIGRIPENRAYKIKVFTSTKDELSEELGRQPTSQEMSKKLGWELAEVDRMESELRNDLVSQGFEDDPYSFTPSKSEETLRLFKYELSGDEREVYEHLTGFGRPQLLSTGDIAKKMGLPDYKVSRIKQVIQNKLKRYINE
jgi:DNA-directed RNA polymerase specialized sigma subunit